MSDDDLVKRLRDFDPHNMHEWEAVDLAADRIEALEQRLEATKDKAETAILDLMAERYRAEARLAKAVAALRFYAEGRWPEDYPGGVLHDVDGVTHIDYGHKATATLAEIEGGNSDE